MSKRKTSAPVVASAKKNKTVVDEEDENNENTAQIMLRGATYSIKHDARGQNPKVFYSDAKTPNSKLFVGRGGGGGCRESLSSIKSQGGRGGENAADFSSGNNLNVTIFSTPGNELTKCERKHNLMGKKFIEWRNKYKTGDDSCFAPTVYIKVKCKCLIF